MSPRSWPAEFWRRERARALLYLFPIRRGRAREPERSDDKFNTQEHRWPARTRMVTPRACEKPAELFGNRGGARSGRRAAATGFAFLGELGHTWFESNGVSSEGQGGSDARNVNPKRGEAFKRKPSRFRRFQRRRAYERTRNGRSLRLLAAYIEALAAHRIGQGPSSNQGSQFGSLSRRHGPAMAPHKGSWITPLPAVRSPDARGEGKNWTVADALLTRPRDVLNFLS